MTMDRASARSAVDILDDLPSGIERVRSAGDVDLLEALVADASASLASLKNYHADPKSPVGDSALAGNGHRLY